MRKLLISLILSILNIPMFFVGWICAPFVENKAFDMPPFISGVCVGFSILIMLYVIYLVID